MLCDDDTVSHSQSIHTVTNNSGHSIFVPSLPPLLLSAVSGHFTSLGVCGSQGGMVCMFMKSLEITELPHNHNEL